MNVYTRVMILGSSGAGKSHLALRLSALAGLPSVHMDQLSWQPGFVHRTTDEINRLTRDVHVQDHWVIEGGHYENCAERARRAHLLICLDVPPLVQAYRVFARSLRYHRKVRPCMADGCPESFGPHTIDAMRYALTSRRFHLERIEDVVKSAPSSLQVRRFRTGRQINRFLSRCLRVPSRRGFLIRDQ